MGGMTQLSWDKSIFTSSSKVFVLTFLALICNNKQTGIILNYIHEIFETINFQIQNSTYTYVYLSSCTNACFKIFLLKKKMSCSTPARPSQASFILNKREIRRKTISTSSLWSTIYCSELYSFSGSLLGIVVIQLTQAMSTKYIMRVQKYPWHTHLLISSKKHWWETALISCWCF